MNYLGLIFFNFYIFWREAYFESSPLSFNLGFKVMTILRYLKPKTYIEPKFVFSTK